MDGNSNGPDPDSEATTVELTTDKIEGECVIYDCTNESSHLWYSFSVSFHHDASGGEIGGVTAFTADYCDEHYENGAEKDGFYYIGEFE